MDKNSEETILKKMTGIFDGSGIKQKIFITVLLAAGILLVGAPAVIESIGYSKSAPEETGVSDEISEYSALLEEGLKQAISQVVGSGNVSVMVTLESTFENVYFSDASVNEAVTADKTDIKSEKQLVLTGASGEGQTPVIVKRLPPKVKGAVIVCDRGDEADIKERVTMLAATALNISETKIYVTGGN